MTKSANSCGLDIQRNYICVAQLNSQEASVQNVAVRPLTMVGTDEFWDSVAAELKGIGKQFRFVGADVVCSVPCDMAAVRTLEADSDERDQDGILRWELEAGLMGAVDDYVFDFYEVDPGNQVDRRRYLAAAIRKEALAKLRKAMKSVKLNPSIVDIDLFALTNVFQTNYRERLAEASMLVHGEFGCTKMILVNNSSYIDCGVLDFDVDERGEAEYAAALRDEVARIMSKNRELVQGEAGVFLAGALFANQQFADSVRRGVPQCEMLDPFRKVECAPEFKQYSSQLAVSVGLALRGDEV